MKSFIFSIAISLGFLLLTLRAIRRKKLQEHQSVIWILVALGLVILSLMLPFDVIGSISHFFGIAYPPNLILLVSILFLIIFVFQLSISITKLTARQKELIQTIGLMSVQEAKEATTEGIAPQELGTREEISGDE
jgi:hypothetical protein